MNKLSIVAFLTGIVLIAGVFTAEARPEYAQKENKQCSYCHLNPGGGGTRGFRGQFYGANGLSFASFDEERESGIAGVDANAEAGQTRPKVAYVGNISGPATKQIQLASLRTPVLVAFFDAASDDAKAAAKELKKIAVAYGRKVTVVGAFAGDTDKTLALTKELGSQIRILPDTDSAAAKKFKATQGLDLVVVGKQGDDSKLISGFSKGNLEAAIAQIGTYGVEAPQVDVSDAPSAAVHGGKIGS
ncbi:MAG TPA: hypothetical protein VG820_13420 [Fimbriimonadaceae bacterium]|nr:hypothetical protein [Fimbriimonadaceae bacterium]